MRFYNQQHRFYCGIDLHARTLAVCILDADGAIAFRGNVAASPQAVREALAPFREGLVVACECLFAWYWLADLGQEEEIPFVLGHALDMKAIHGGKTKNDSRRPTGCPPAEPGMSWDRLRARARRFEGQAGGTDEFPVRPTSWPPPCTTSAGEP